MPLRSFLRIRLTGVLALTVAAACAHGPTSPHGRRQLSDPGPLAQAWRLPSRCVKADGTVLTESALFGELAAARVVYVAEQHSSPHDHAVQLQVIDGLHQQNPSMAIGLEMVKRPFQRWLDDYVAGRIDEPTMLEGAEWKQRWGFDFGLYRPILAYARTHRIPLVALNIKDEITRQVARTGLESLSAEDQELIPEIDFDNAEHRSMVRAVYDRHMSTSKMTFDNFYTAQLLWDETMANEVARVMTAPDAPAMMVVLAGSGHIRYAYGIPSRAARRGVTSFKTVLPVLLEKAEVPVADMAAGGIADYLWIMSADERNLPRVGPHPHPHPSTQPSSQPASRPRTTAAVAPGLSPTIESSASGQASRSASTSSP